MLWSVLPQKLVRSCRTKRPAPKKDSLFLVSSVWKQQIAFPFRDLGEFSQPLASGRLGVCPTHASVTFFSPWPSWSGLYPVSHPDPPGASCTLCMSPQQNFQCSGLTASHQGKRGKDAKIVADGRLCSALTGEPSVLQHLRCSYLSVAEGKWHKVEGKNNSSSC